MSWYYVGPDAKPVGPISLEELQGRRSTGVVGPDTYVIEAPAGSAPKEWRRFRDVFPPPATLPPLPTATPPPAPTMGVPHPIFPTVPPATPSPGGPVFTGSHPSTYHLPPSRTNPWCSWAFGLGLGSFLGLAVCGLGALLSVPALVVSIVALVQTGHQRGQGRGLAVTGLILSILSLLFAIGLGVAVAMGSWHSGLQMTTEQTSNDSDTR